ncbi:hypothetical protein [Helicobacter sp. T3_23-1059]
MSLDFLGFRFCVGFMWLGVFCGVAFGGFCLGVFVVEVGFFDEFLSLRASKVSVAQAYSYKVAI